jgi:hypothetical protein
MKTKTRKKAPSSRKKSPAAKKKAGRRKTIMRHSKEG